MMATIQELTSDYNAAIDYAKSLIIQLKLGNMSQGINAGQALWVHHRLRALEITYNSVPMVVDVMNMVVSGDIGTAYIAFSLMAPDDMTQSYHWFSQPRIDQIKALLGQFLGYA